VRARVGAALDRIEREEDVRVLYAVESGSRAWGFASTDSDWDVRFLYVRWPPWYLSIEPGRDVIEEPIDGDLDVSGWDVPKALRLLRKGNAVLPEWLASPVVYRESGSLASRLRAIVARDFRTKRALHHYRSMANKNYRDYLRRPTVRTKKYLYVLRPLLACSWIEDEGAAPPVEFARLLDAQLPDGPVREEIDDLLARKKAGEELDEGPRVPLLNRFIEDELARSEVALAARPEDAGVGLEPLNELFRGVLEEAWQH